jgi:hypothetical protein
MMRKGDRAGLRRPKHHCERLKTFSTTPESRFQDQGSDRWMPHIVRFYFGPNASSSFALSDSDRSFVKTLVAMRLFYAVAN